VPAADAVPPSTGTGPHSRWSVLRRRFSVGIGTCEDVRRGARGADNYLDHVIVRPTSVGLAPCFLCQRFSDEEPPLIG
jgi:hypothetical protein